jgi:hypothetical protein
MIVTSPLGLEESQDDLDQVVFPEPFAPMRARKSPRLIRKLTSRRTGAIGEAESRSDVDEGSGSAAVETIFETSQVPSMMSKNIVGADLARVRLWPGLRIRVRTPSSVTGTSPGRRLRALGEDGFDPGPGHS